MYERSRAKLLGGGRREEDTTEGKRQQRSLKMIKSIVAIGVKVANRMGRFSWMIVECWEIKHVLGSAARVSSRRVHVWRGMRMRMRLSL